MARRKLLKPVPDPENQWGSVEMFLVQSQELKTLSSLARTVIESAIRSTARADTEICRFSVTREVNPFSSEDSSYMYCAVGVGNF